MCLSNKCTASQSGKNGYRNICSILLARGGANDSRVCNATISWFGGVDALGQEIKRKEQ